MLKFLRSLFAPSAPAGGRRPPSADEAPAPARIELAGTTAFPLSEHLGIEHGLPVLDWDAVSRWLDGIGDESVRAAAWAHSELAWLAHLRDALGARYRLTRTGKAVLLSTLEDGTAQATLAFMTRTIARIGKVLGGLAQPPEWGHDILIVFDDEDAYYRYVARYYPEDGEFARSSGMYINAGCGHFVTLKSDLHAVEPVIAHEMTHGSLGHLPLPLWLNEGLAVNTEQRLCPPAGALYTPLEMHARHLAFWGTAEIQEFWSGRSFHRTDDGNMLSYDLARILVAQFARDWGAFAGFARAARQDDAGQDAAIEHLGLSLGAAACAILERDPDQAWEPQADTWASAAADTAAVAGTNAGTRAKPLANHGRCC